ncbi:hypothetical protein MWN34_15520 [Ancylobacter sp. 6x-1]|uniref:Uncharacterized protein n=1 Tax=Ancylobacter crimeensis TaxID=2579147 RepID=A0ABT0DEE9_9HYPH|nr:hypothetical protein [Ancylobacter crimeensis]MCK0198321.1 hypothetical protein [Ancylobacter crimeensis]
MPDRAHPCGTRHSARAARPGGLLRGGAAALVAALALGAAALPAAADEVYVRASDAPYYRGPYANEGYVVREVPAAPPAVLVPAPAMPRQVILREVPPPGAVVRERTPDRIIVQQRAPDPYEPGCRTVTRDLPSGYRTVSTDC